MKNLIFIIVFLSPFLCFAQRFVIPFADAISLNLPAGVDIYAMHNKSDTLFVKLGIGDAQIYDQEISFNSDQLPSTISIEQQIEYCLSISDEGPHVDLRNWLHAYTPWLSVPRSGEKYKLWSNPQAKPKPAKPTFDVDSDEFLMAIEAEGFDGKAWQEAAQRSHSLYWLKSKLILNVRWRENGRPQQKIIVLELPMGC